MKYLLSILLLITLIYGLGCSIKHYNYHPPDYEITVVESHKSK